MHKRYRLAWLLIFLLRRIFYKMDVRGRSHVPRKGPALLVSNHVSFVDALLIASSLGRREVTFLMARSYFNLPFFSFFFKFMGVIPISDKDSPKAVLGSLNGARKKLQEGALVCIFAEGTITRHGQMLRFKKGFERIVKGLDAKVIPVHLDRLWGSLFSFEGGKVLFKRLRPLPYPVTVSFGKPCPSSASARDVRWAIQELACEAFSNRLDDKPSLPVTFVREAKRHWSRFALADSSGEQLSYGEVLVRAVAMSNILGKLLPKGGTVGILLPPSVPGALSVLAVSLSGRVPVPLNYTSSRELSIACAYKAGAEKIITSRRFLKTLGWRPENMIFLEDLEKPSKVEIFGLTAALFCLPSSIIEKRYLPKAGGSLDRLATVIFTSGSTGLPKGVMLTHANLLSNIEAICQLYHVTQKDRVLGVLPFFHSFGYTVTLWLPLVMGIGVVYHHDPFDARTIGRLVRRRKVTVLIGTPTFLMSYVRRTDAELFKSLRLVVAGAEKLWDSVSKAFEEKFGVRVLEGYGCTELSPVASGNIPDVDWDKVRQKGTKPGTIGQPLPGVLMRVVDPVSGEPVADGAPGLLLVKGPNIMKGYLGEPGLTAEVMRDGYYVTGDIAVIDADGFVSITDRLSRFSKIAGEMVPHGGLETSLHELAGGEEQDFFVSAVPDERRGERLVVLYRGEHDIEALRKRLEERGMPRLWIPEKSGFHRITDVPRLGTGKVDIKALKSLAQEMEA